MVGVQLITDRDQLIWVRSRVSLYLLRQRLWYPIFFAGVYYRRTNGVYMFPYMAGSYEPEN